MLGKSLSSGRGNDLSDSSKQQVAKEEERRAKAEDGCHFDVDEAHARSVHSENHGRGHQHTCEAVALSHPILRPSPPTCQEAFAYAGVAGRD